jgi:hypothetical protein
MVSRLLEQLTEEINPRPLPVGLAHAILSQSDEIIRLGDEDWSLVRIDNGLRLDWLLVAALRAALPENRAAMICSWLDGADGTLGLAAFIETLTGKNAGNSGEDILPADTHGMLREKAIELMARSADNSGLLKRADCGRVLFAWVRLTNYETVSGWPKAALANDDAVIDLATIIPDEVRSSNKGIYYVVNRDAWSKLIDLDEYSRRLHAIGARDPKDKTMSDAIAKFDAALAHEG